MSDAYINVLFYRLNIEHTRLEVGQGEGYNYSIKHTVKNKQLLMHILCGAITEYLTNKEKDNVS